MSEENRAMTKSREGPASTFNGYLFLLLLFAAIALGVWRVIEFNIGGPTALGGMLFGLAIFLFVFFIAGFFMIQPNQAVVVTLFGEYRGTERTQGLRWIWPWMGRKKVSVRAHNIHS